MFRLAALLALLLAVAHGAAAQPIPSPGEGRPLFARRISWRESGGNAQNWGFAQHPDGRIYVANTEGILEYDGVDWRIYQTAQDQRFLIHSVAADARGRMFAGGIAELGLLEPDSVGTLRFRSLTPQIPIADRDFSDVWTTYATADGIVFQSANRLFRWNGRRMEVWRTDTRFRSAFLIGGRVYVWEEGVGIKRLGPSGLTLMPGGAAFANRKVDALLVNGTGWIAVVRDEGLVGIRADGTTRAIGGPASDYLRTFRPYSAVAVPNLYAGRGMLYAVATFGGGIALVTPDGYIVRVYREDIGLRLGDDILGLFADAQGGLWAALQNGMVRLDPFPRHTWFDESDGLLGSPNTVVDYDGEIYVGTDVGLFRRTTGRLGRPGSDETAYSLFEQIRGFPWERKQVWDLASTVSGMVVASDDGVFVLQGGRIRQLLTGTAYSVAPVPGRSDQMLVGTLDGVVRLVLRGGAWTAAGTLPGITGETRFIQEDAVGALWISQPGGRLYRIRYPASAHPAVESYGPEEGMTQAPGPLNLVGDHLLVSTRAGVFRIEPVGRRVRLVREAAMAHLGGAYGLFAPTGTDPWTFLDGRLRSAARTGFELGNLQPNDVVVQRSGVSWIATSDGLLRYDPRVRLGARGYTAMVRRVTNRDRSVLFGGASGVPLTHGVELELPIERARGLRVEYAAALFDRPGKTEFSTRLLGSDDETWGPWSGENVSQFIGIREGTYAFEIRARDDAGHETSIASFRMRILPPWYRTWWAYSLYGLALAGFIWAVTAWRLHKQRLRLEAARARNQRMQRLSARLKETNTRLRHADTLKDDLLANTSHELRTPLTAVLGFSELLLDEADASIRDLAAGIQSGGKRLLATVDALLDMFKLQAGTAETYPEPVDAAAVVHACVRTMAPLAERAGLALHVVPEGLDLPAEIDRGALERILAHLVGNAIRFTPAGTVTVLVDATDHVLSVAVRDTGIGIPADQIEAVFEPFEQVSTGYARSHEGNGLGLSIVRGLADMLGGTVAVESVLGAGTTVRIEIPRWAERSMAVRRAAHAATNPALGGAQILTVGLGSDAAAIRSWLAPQGTVCEAETTGQGVREAKKLAYDAVFVAGASRESDLKRLRLLRTVPGYAALPVLRVGDAPLDESDLTARGFSHQLTLPLGADAVVTLLEALLMTVEEAVDD